jgi:hypothetical protein
MTALAAEPAAALAGRGLNAHGELALSCLVQHRLMTTSQVHEAIGFDVVDGAYRSVMARRHVQRELRELHQRGLADFVTAPTTARERRWFAPSSAPAPSKAPRC